MEDIDGSGTGQRGGQPRRCADIFAVHEDSHVPSQRAGLISNLESKTRVPFFEYVEKMVHGIGRDFLISAGTELPQPAIQMHFERGSR